jgi:hypothetical protein
MLRYLTIRRDRVQRNAATACAHTRPPTPTGKPFASFGMEGGPSIACSSAESRDRNELSRRGHHSRNRCCNRDLGVHAGSGMPTVRRRHRPTSWSLFRDSSGLWNQWPSGFHPHRQYREREGMMIMRILTSDLPREILSALIVIMTIGVVLLVEIGF